MCNVGIDVKMEWMGIIVIMHSQYIFFDENKSNIYEIYIFGEIIIDGDDDIA